MCMYSCFCWCFKMCWCFHSGNSFWHLSVHVLCLYFFWRQMSSRHPQSFTQSRKFELLRSVLQRGPSSAAVTLADCPSCAIWADCFCAADSTSCRAITAIRVATISICKFLILNIPQNLTNWKLLGKVIQMWWILFYNHVLVYCFCYQLCI